jgi:hypothetical protein
VGLVGSLAAREVIVSTLAQIYAVSDENDSAGLRDALHADVDPRTGRAVYSLPVALSLLVFFVFALQCTSTIVVMARETGSWRWPALALFYTYGLAWRGWRASRPTRWPARSPSAPRADALRGDLERFAAGFRRRVSDFCLAAFLRAPPACAPGGARALSGEPRRRRIRSRARAVRSRPSARSRGLTRFVPAITGSRAA